MGHWVETCEAKVKDDIGYEESWDKGQVDEE